MPRLLKLDSRPIAYDSLVESTAAADLDGDIEDDVEMAEWRPVRPELPVATPSIAFVDGVERRERRVWAEGEGMPIPGLLASYAAGAVWPGRTPAFRHIEVRRRAILAAGAFPMPVALRAHNGGV